MTKIISISLALFLLCNNQLKCEDKQTLQQITCSGNNATPTIELHNDAQIEFFGNDNSLKCNVLPSVKKIVIESHGNDNQIIVNMPFSGEMPEVVCHMYANGNDVTIYSFEDVKKHYVDYGNYNSCRVVSPLRKLFTPIAVSGAMGLLLYWNLTKEK